MSTVTEGRPLLSDLVGAGSALATLRFGVDGDPISAEHLLVDGSKYFGHGDAECVGLIATNDRSTVEVFLGAIATGARVVSLPLPGRGSALTDYVHFLERAAESHGVKEVLARDDYAKLLDSVGITSRAHSDVARAPLAAPRDGGFSLVQYSSGSTADPKSILHNDQTLGANVDAIMRMIEPRPGDGTVSWLPLSHDMGLVGILFTGIASMSRDRIGHGDVVLMEPEQFLRAPRRWLAAIDQFQASISAVPDFGLRHAAATAPRDALDLSSMRCLIVGGEVVRADTLTTFARTFARCGLVPTSICPSYGLAEIGVAATMTRPSDDWSSFAVDAVGLANDRLLAPTKSSGLIDLVSCGEPLDDYAVEAPGDGFRVGPITISGPSVGYDANGESLAGPDGRLRTGDKGFVRGGKLFISGRDDDYVVVRGRTVYAPQIERTLDALPGIRPGRTIAVVLGDGRFVVACEIPRSAGNLADSDRLLLVRAVRRAVISGIQVDPDEIEIMSPGMLPMTSSGKIQRSKAAAMLAAIRFGDDGKSDLTGH